MQANAPSPREGLGGRRSASRTPTPRRRVRSIFGLDDDPDDVWLQYIGDEVEPAIRIYLRHGLVEGDILMAEAFGCRHAIRRAFVLRAHVKDLRQSLIHRQPDTAVVDWVCAGDPVQFVRFVHHTSIVVERVARRVASRARAFDEHEANQLAIAENALNVVCAAAPAGVDIPGGNPRRAGPNVAQIMVDHYRELHHITCGPQGLQLIREDGHLERFSRFADPERITAHRPAEGADAPASGEFVLR